MNGIGLLPTVIVSVYLPGNPIIRPACISGGFPLDPTLLFAHPTMIRHPRSACIFTMAALLLLSPAPSRAQSPPPAPPSSAAVTPPSPPAAAQPAEDDATLRLAEPDFSLVNLPTTLPLPAGKGDFHLVHRFNGNLRQGSFGDQASSLFGLDEGATVAFEYRFGVMRHLEAIAERSNVDRDIQLSAKYDAVQQNASQRVGISGVASIEGGNNFRERYAPALGLVVSRTIEDRAAFYAVPVWLHNSAALTGTTRDTFFVGVGGRVRLASDVYVVGEVSPRVAGYVIGDPEFGFGIEKRVGGHVFQLTFANTHATSYGQIARGGNPESLYLGFNLTRKFF